MTKTWTKLNIWRMRPIANNKSSIKLGILWTSSNNELRTKEITMLCVQRLCLYECVVCACLYWAFLNTRTKSNWQSETLCVSCCEQWNVVLLSQTTKYYARIVEWIQSNIRIFLSTMFAYPMSCEIVDYPIENHISCERFAERWFVNHKHNKRILYILCTQQIYSRIRSSQMTTKYNHKINK